MPGLVPTEWAELVGEPYYIITRDRPDVHIVELGMGEPFPAGPADDDTRVCVWIDMTSMTVGSPASYSWPASFTAYACMHWLVVCSAE